MSRGGRGRGGFRAGGSMPTEALGIKSRDAIPPPLLHPPPLFPPLERKPLELRNDDMARNILTCKKDYDTRLRQSPFYIKPLAQKDTNKITRYSDRYKTSHVNDITQLLNNIPNWKAFMPKELHFVKRKSRKSIKSMKVSTPSIDHTHTVTDISTRLNQLEEKEQSSGVGVGTTGTADSDDEEGVADQGEEYYDEEVEEEEGDYQQTYFDPGDEFGVDEDDALDDGII